jgi:hypothetical protein
MFLLDVLRDHVWDKVSEVVSELDHDIKFVNVEGHKWQVQISFDLADLNEVERGLLESVLKFL